MQWSNGFLTLGHPAGIPIRVHWSSPVGALIFSHFTWSPGFWLGFFLLILFHELGHAFLIKINQGKVTEVIIHGIGGECRHLGGMSEIQSAVISWGGVLAQGIILIGALLYRTFVGISSSFEAQLLAVWIESNLFLIGLNLLPFAPLDGASAWRLPKLLMNRSKRPVTKSRPHLRVVQGGKRAGDSPSSTNDPVVSDALKKELDRITREALRDARKDKN